MDYLLYVILGSFIGWFIVTIIFKVIEYKNINKVYVPKPTKIELSEGQKKISDRLDEMLIEFKTNNHES